MFCIRQCMLLLPRSVIQVPLRNLKALVTGCSLFRLLLSGATFLLTSDTAVLSHSSKLLLKLFSLLLPILSYSNLSQALDAVLDLIFCCWLTDVCVCIVVLGGCKAGGGGGGLRERGGGKRGVVRLCGCACGCGCWEGGVIEWDM